MHHEQWNHMTMIAPAAGFTGRVMARIAERERAVARRRAMIGAGVLVIAASVLIALVGGLVLLVVTAALDMPDAIFSGLDALAPLFDLAGTIGRALWSSALAFADNVSMALVLVYALFVCALTVLWAQLVSGSSQPASQTLSMGEQK